ncbi:hypothetical protein TNIN_242321 [Trichonephila inaurata madagascariensis]|uniref:Uncharacterized protein n=1 Tax=Trichonephila inaurata madagascariensis TaxID=2747483 RepID=A0A8X6YS71_9ARAC|nr:hypothetical protein TNIN_242321 [Trichonephila inaurata madagascariensis]
MHLECLVKDIELGRFLGRIKLPDGICIRMQWNLSETTLEALLIVRDLIQFSVIKFPPTWAWTIFPSYLLRSCV